MVDNKLPNEKIRDVLLNSLVYPDGPKFWKAKDFPIPSTIGEGHKFHANNRNYTTVARRDKSSCKRVICADITSYRGYCAEARHYYCRLRSIISNVDEAGTYSFGYMGGYKIPQEFTSIDVELGRRVTTEIIETNEMGRWDGYAPGDMTNAFDSKKEIYKLIDFLKIHVFTENEWLWKIDDAS